MGSGKRTQGADGGETGFLAQKFADAQGFLWRELALAAEGDEGIDLALEAAAAQGVYDVVQGGFGVFPGVRFFEERRGVAGECFAMLAAAEVLDEDGGGGARIERADFDGVDERGAGAPFGFGLVEWQEFDREPGGEQRMGDE